MQGDYKNTLKKPEKGVPMRGDLEKSEPKRVKRGEEKERKKEKNKKRKKKRRK
ncbi:hypothetical protein HIR72_02590 [Pasteurella multocida]|uniref:hypothetical protein n=1 Tax=Pasteurella multocida TaxID=747 RepID=UPI0014615EAB|nr:hypothetical protein [Pasteurella multocida]NMR59569.1 hypothetical protein [Pasteurella multocida]